MSTTDYILASYLNRYFGNVDVVKLERKYEYASLYGYATGAFVHSYIGAPVWSRIESTALYDFNQCKLIEYDFCLQFSTRRTLFYRVLGALGYEHRSFELRVNLLTFMTFCSSLNDINIDINNLIKKDETLIRVGKFKYNIRNPEIVNQKGLISSSDSRNLVSIDFVVIKGELSKRSKFYQIARIVVRIVLFGIVLKGVWDFATFLQEIIYPLNGR